MNKQFQSFKKRATRLAVTAALVGATVVGANAAQLGQTTGRVNFRKDATTKSQVISKISKGTDITITGEKGNFFKIKYDNQVGYVSKKYVNENKYSVKSLTGTVTAKNGVNLRKGPGTSYEKAGRLNAGEKLEVVGQASNGWYQVKLANGLTAFVSNSAKYIQYDEKTPAPEQKGEAPVITVKDTYTLVQGKEFKNEDLGATAKDEEGVDLTSAIKYDGDVDTTKPGTYTVKLSVTDKDGNEGTATVKVIVKEKDTNKPFIDVQVNTPYKLRVNKEYKDSDLQAFAYDNEDGPLTTKIVYTYKDSTGKKVDKIDTSKEGKYTVTLTVTDSSDNISTKNVEVIIANNNAPQLSCKLPNNTYKLKKGKAFDISDKTKLLDILQVTAYDKEDGNLTSKIEYTVINSSGVKVNEVKSDTLDTKYTVRFTVEDSDGSQVTKDVTIVVVPTGVPVMNFYNEQGEKLEDETKTKNVKAENNQDTSKEGLIKLFNLKAYDKDGGNDITKDIAIYEIINLGDVDNTNDDKEVTSIDSSKDGDYKITFKVTDDSQSVRKTGMLHVYSKANNHPPQINCNLSNDTYKLEIDKTFDISDKTKLLDILQVTAYDKEDGDLTSKIEYTVLDSSGTKVNEVKSDTLNTTYTVKFSVADSNGSQVAKDVKIIVVPAGVLEMNFYNEQGEKLDDETKTKNVKTESKQNTSNESLIKLFNLKAYDRDNKNDIKKDITKDIVIDEIISLGDVENTNDDQKVTSIDSSTDGDYKITFKVTGDSQSVTKTGMLHVYSKANNHTPQINCNLSNDTYKLEIGKTFDISDKTKLLDILQVTAYDKEDGDLTSKIDYTVLDSSGTIVNEVKSDKVGTTYTVKFTVADSDDSQVTKDVTIEVIGLKTIAFYDEDDKNPTTPERLGKWVYVNLDKSTPNVTEKGLIELFNVKAYDKKDGNDITSDIVISKIVDETKSVDFEESHEVQVQSIEIGDKHQYTITFEITDDDKSAQVTGVLTMYSNDSNQAPLLYTFVDDEDDDEDDDDEEHEYTFDNIRSVTDLSEALQGHVKAYDIEDQCDLTSKITYTLLNIDGETLAKLSDGTTINNLTLSQIQKITSRLVTGNYKLKMSVTDSDEKTTELVKDVICP